MTTMYHRSMTAYSNSHRHLDDAALKCGRQLHPKGPSGVPNETEAGRLSTIRRPCSEQVHSELDLVALI